MVFLSIGAKEELGASFRLLPLDVTKKTKNS